MISSPPVCITSFALGHGRWRLGRRSSATSWCSFLLSYNIASRHTTFLQELDVLLRQCQVVSHTCSHIADELSVLAEPLEQQVLLTFQLRRIEHDLSAHLMQLAALLHACDQSREGLKCLLHLTTGCVQILDQVLWVPKFIFALINAEVSILSL